MKSVDIPREIQQENKVVLMFTLRQLICVVIAAILCFIIAVILNMEFSLAVYPCIVIGVIAFAFGWIKPDGLTFEQLLLKEISKRLYKSHIRKYRTKNKYIPLMNEEYRRHRAADERNKKVVRTIKKEARAEKKKLRKQKCRGFA